MKTRNYFKTFLVVLISVFAFVQISVVLTSEVLADDGQKVEKGKNEVVVDKAKNEKSAKTEKDLSKIKGSDKKGKFYYKKQCKSCHGKKDDGGEITPVSKTIKQWERFFKKDKHGEKKLSDDFDAEHLIHIKTFLKNHAADSDQPETCG